MNPKTLVKKHAMDAGFVLAAAACLTTFIVRQLNVKIGERARGMEVARVTQGAVARKSTGMAAFSDIPVNTPLFHRDVLWVGENKQAEISFDYTTRMRILEKTYLIITRGLKSGAEHNKVELLLGKVEIKPMSGTLGGKTLEINTRDQHLIVDPSKDNLTVSAEGGEKVADTTEKPPAPKPSSDPLLESRKTDPQVNPEYPRQNSILMLLSGQATAVTFAWPASVKGDLVVVSQPGSVEVARVAVEKERFAKVKIPAGKNYEWRISDPQAATVYGPYQFGLFVQGIDSINLGKKTETHPMIEILSQPAE